MHERGLAIDFSCNGTLIARHNNPCFGWLEEHAARYDLFNRVCPIVCVSGRGVSLVRDGR
jgi:hypothetical protein